jgi:hypothetical protein
MSHAPRNAAGTLSHPVGRPLTRAQALENAAFLAELRRTGNAREAARRLGAHRAKFTKRRASHPGFAVQWEAALALAQQALAQETLARRELATQAASPSAEPTLVRRTDGCLQLRRARPGGIDRAGRTRFLAALSACANVRLAARAAGFSHAAFYHHKRRDPAFAREWRLALETGYLRLEAALLGGWMPDGGADDTWRHNDPPPIPPMSPAQALQLLYLHQKEARLWTTPEPLRKRRGETNEARVMRLTLVHEARTQRQRDIYDTAEAARREPRAAAPSPHEPPPPILPDLAQVTGWSQASGRPAFDEDVALFGGWRLGDERR